MDNQSQKCRIPPSYHKIKCKPCRINISAAYIVSTVLTLDSEKKHRLLKSIKLSEFQLFQLSMHLAKQAKLSFEFSPKNVQNLH
jgi:hypothetical protein